MRTVLGCILNEIFQSSFGSNGIVNRALKGIPVKHIAIRVKVF
jgi:hypothetical protein